MPFPLELVETFLYCSHKLNTLGDILERTVVWQGSDSFKHDLFLSHGSIMRLTDAQVNIGWALD